MNGPRFLPSGSRFGPCSCRRRAASAASRPFAQSVTSDFTTSPADIACQALTSGVIVRSATTPVVSDWSVFIRLSGQARRDCKVDVDAAKQTNSSQMRRRAFTALGVDTRTLGHYLRMETLDILPTAQLGARGQDGRGAGGHAEHEGILDMFSACERESHARHKTIACPHSAHRLHLGTPQAQRACAIREQGAITSQAHSKVFDRAI